MMNWLKKLILLIQTNKIFNKKIEDVNKKIIDISTLIVTQDFIRLTNIDLMQEWKKHQKTLQLNTSRECT